LNALQRIDLDLTGSAKRGRRGEEPIGSSNGMDLPRLISNRIGREPKNDAPESEPSKTDTNDAQYTPLPERPVKTPEARLAPLLVANGHAPALVSSPPRVWRARPGGI